MPSTLKAMSNPAGAQAGHERRGSGVLSTGEALSWQPSALMAVQWENSGTKEQSPEHLSP